MNNIRFNIPQEKTVIHIDSLISKLEETYKNIYVYRKVSVIRDEEESLETVLTNIENLKEIDFDCKYDNELCLVVLKNGTKLTILKEEKKEKLIMTTETLENNEDLILLDSIAYYKGPLPQTIKTSYEKEINMPLDKNPNKYLLKHLLGYMPDAIYLFLEDQYITKNHNKNGTNKVRFKFINQTNLSNLDDGFYENIKIRITDTNILKYQGYIFIRTDNNNCFILKEKNKILA